MPDIDLSLTKNCLYFVLSQGSLESLWDFPDLRIALAIRESETWPEL